MMFSPRAISSNGAADTILVEVDGMEKRKTAFLFAFHMFICNFVAKRETNRWAE